MADMAFSGAPPKSSGFALPQLTSSDQGYSNYIDLANQQNAVGLAMYNKQYQDQREMQADLNAFNAQQAQINRDWQERMSSTSYQRAVADLKKAGLNPILAVQGSGFGASTPAGASAQASTPTAPSSQMNQSLLGSLIDLEKAKMTSAATISSAMSNADATKVMAQLGLLGTQYSADISKLITQMNIENPTTLWGIIAQLVTGATGEGSVKDVGAWFAELISDALDKGYQKITKTTPSDIAKKQAQETLQETKAKERFGKLTPKSKREAVAGK